MVTLTKRACLEDPESVIGCSRDHGTFLSRPDFHEGHADSTTIDFGWRGHVCPHVCGAPVFCFYEEGHQVSSPDALPTEVLAKVRTFCYVVIFFYG